MKKEDVRKVVKEILRANNIYSNRVELLFVEYICRSPFSVDEIYVDVAFNNTLKYKLFYNIKDEEGLCHVGFGPHFKDRTPLDKVLNEIECLRVLML